MKLKSIVELTPLLDVFLILIFAFMINARQTASEQQLRVELTEHDNSLLRMELEAKAQQIEQYQQNLDSSQIRALRYEQELSAQKILLDETLGQIEEKMRLFFTESKSSLQARTQSGEVAQLDYDNFAQRLEQMELTPSASFIEQVYILGELNAYSTTISVYLDDSNRVWIDRQPTQIALTTFDEATGTFAPSLVEAFSNELHTALLAFYEGRKKGESKLGEVVLFTFGHGSAAMRGVIQATGSTTERVYRHVQHNEGSFRKVFYSNLGFYPFEQRIP